MPERLRLQEGWLTVFLLLVILSSVAMSISAAAWTRGLENLLTATILAFFAGLLLSKSRFPAFLTHAFSLVYGLFVVSYLVGRMLDYPTWNERIVELGERMVTWLTKATTGGTSRDSLMFVLLLTALFWILGYIVAWYTFRRPRLWRVLLPTGLTLLVNQYVYTDPRISTRSTASLIPYIVVFLLAALLYAVRTYIYMRELEWKSTRVSYSPEIRVEFIRAGALLAVVALLVMVLAPGARAGPSIGTLWGGLEDFRQGVRRTATRLFSSLDTYSRSVANPFSGQTVLGGPRNLGDEVVFDIVAPGGRYWRAMVYDRYTGDSWVNSDDHQIVRPPGESINYRERFMRREVTQTVTVYLRGNTQLFAAPEPLRALNFSTQADVSFEQGQVTPPSTLHSREKLDPGDTYWIVSLVSQASPDNLRRAGQSYPDWITARYLQLPDTVTERTHALAQEITADPENVFDKARAIEEYLRQNLRYSLDVPAPPEGQDFVDFTLFDLQAGYCDYYATSFVVLARSAGIPARIGFGYAQDTFDQEAQAYRVRAKNGHSWPEVYFPGYGWIQFEPTVIIDPINWPAPPSDSSAAEDAAEPEPEDLFDRPERDRPLPEEPDMPAGGTLDPDSGGSGGLSPLFFILLGLLLVAGAGTGLTYWATEIRGLGGLNLVERAYARLWRFAARLGIPHPPDQTPYERAEALTTLIPEGREPIQHITTMYVVQRFGRRDVNKDEEDAEDRWSSLRPLLWKNWLEKKFSRFQRRERRRRWEDFYKTSRTG